MKPVHEKLPKENRPESGEVYTFAHGGTPRFEAEIVKYGGGCWARVRVRDSHAGEVYRPGDEFDIKIAQYEFRPAGQGE
jgi:hypothetical protein